MRWSSRFGVLASVVAAGLFGVGAQAEAAAAPHNVGWLYTLTGSGAGFFDADLAGYPSYEKITVCDNLTDGRGIIINLWGISPAGRYVKLSFRDPSHDGTCEANWDNYFADGFKVDVEVCEYWGTHQEFCGSASGVA